MPICPASRAALYWKTWNDTKAGTGTRANQIRAATVIKVDRATVSRVESRGRSVT